TGVPYERVPCLLPPAPPVARVEAAEPARVRCDLARQRVRERMPDAPGKDCGDEDEHDRGRYAGDRRRPLDPPARRIGQAEAPTNERRRYGDDHGARDEGE